MDMNSIQHRDLIDQGRMWRETEKSATQNPQQKKEELRMRDACEQFEGLLLGIMLKEALSRDTADSEGDMAAGFDQFREFCVEQVATSVSKSSSTGIADQLYEQMSQQGRIAR